MAESTTALTRLLESFRKDAKSERGKGRYFEDLALIYFRHDAKQASCYDQVWRGADWARESAASTRWHLPLLGTVELVGGIALAASPDFSPRGLNKGRVLGVNVCWNKHLRTPETRPYGNGV